MKILNFVFEKIEDHLNFTNCKDLNNSGISRFTPSPVATSCLRNFQTQYINYDVDFLIQDTNNFDAEDIIIIPTGVAHSPPDWCGYLDLGKRYTDVMNKTNSVMYYLNDTSLRRLKEKTAFLLIDQTHEGYHAEWLYEWFHDMCSTYSVSPTQVIYITGDLDSKEKYAEWCSINNINECLHVIGQPHFENVIYTESVNKVKMRNEPPVPNFAKHVMHKKNNSIYLYNCLQKRARAHRAWMFKELWNNNLLQDGILSMNSFEKRYSYYEGREINAEDYSRIKDLLPCFPPSITTTYDQDRFISPSGSGYISTLNEDIMLDSWVSVISEASFAENQCFISEKTFKPIVCFHPFIIYGNKGSLKRLHEMGYKTFDKWWDEKYDTLDTWERLNSIINIIKNLQTKTQQEIRDMFIEMSDVLKFNAKHFTKRNNSVNPIVHQLTEIVNVS